MIPHKKVCITQSNYIPWKGYFKNISDVDVFVLYDDMQYTKRDWRNRNLIKTPDGLKWLTIPVEVRGKFTQRINEVMISDKSWQKNHLLTIKQFYKKSKYYREIIDIVEFWYNKASFEYLSDINLHFIRSICDFYDIKTTIIKSDEFDMEGDRTDKLVGICNQLGATSYYTGPAARNYMEESKFTVHNISVNYFQYDNYPEYDQLYAPYQHGVTILDMIFNLGYEGKTFFKDVN